MARHAGLRHALPTQLEYAGHRQDGEDAQAEAHVGEDLVEGAEQRHRRRHESLEQDGAVGHAAARMDRRGEAEETAVASHGVVHARTEDDVGAERREQGERHHHGEDRFELRPEQTAGREPGHGDFAGHVARRQRVEIEQVQRQVHQDHRQGAAHQGPGHGSPRIADLGTDVRGRVPAAVGEADPHQGQPHGHPAPESRSERRPLRQMSPVASPDGQSRHHQARDEEHLQHGEDVLNPGAQLQSPHVDGREHQDHNDGVDPGQDGGFGLGPEKPPAEQSRESLGEVRGEADGRGGDGRRKAGEERNPAAQEAEHRMEQAREEHVLAPRPRDGRAERPIAEGAAEGDRAAHRPERQHRPGIAQILEQQSGGGEYPRPDHVGDDDR